jgi:hypothetical protein
MLVATKKHISAGAKGLLLRSGLVSSLTETNRSSITTTIEKAAVLRVRIVPAPKRRLMG